MVAQEELRPCQAERVGDRAVERQALLQPCQGVGGNRPGRWRVGPPSRAPWPAPPLGPRDPAPAPAPATPGPRAARRAATRTTTMPRPGAARHRIAAVAGAPVQGGADVAQLGLAPIQPGDLLRAEELVLGLLGQGQEPRGVSTSDPSASPLASSCSSAYSRIISSIWNRGSSLTSPWRSKLLSTRDARPSKVSIEPSEFATSVCRLQRAAAGENTNSAQECLLIH